MHVAPPHPPPQGHDGQLNIDLFLESALAVSDLWLISKTNPFDSPFEVGRKRTERAINDTHSKP